MFRRKLGEPRSEGREVFAVALFVFETFYVYVTLFKEMLDTAFFLLGGGAVLLGLAYGLRRFTAKPKGVAA